MNCIMTFKTRWSEVGFKNVYLRLKNYELRHLQFNDVVYLNFAEDLMVLKMVYHTHGYRYIISYCAYFLACAF
jgi:hypothetical protein